MVLTLKGEKAYSAPALLPGPERTSQWEVCIALCSKDGSEVQEVAKHLLVGGWGLKVLCQLLSAMQPLSWVSFIGQAQSHTGQAAHLP